MRSAVLVLIAALLGACANPVAQQAAVDTRYDPSRLDSMLAITWQTGDGALSPAQAGDLRAMVSAGRRAQRDEFVVVSDGSGGPMQQMRAARVGQSLADAGARWVRQSVEPAMAAGPNTVVVVRSEYLIGTRNCPNFNPVSMANPNEAAMPGFGCADAYNMGQMLARPRDAAVGRSPGPADGTVSAEAIMRYREGRVFTSGATSTLGANTGAAATPAAPQPVGAGATPAANTNAPPPSN